MTEAQKARVLSEASPKTGEVHGARRGNYDAQKQMDDRASPKEAEREQQEQQRMAQYAAR